MRYFLIGIIKIYQMTPLPIHSLCRHTPTCSQYTIDAITKYGSMKGMYLGLKRILKCNPLGTKGYDPVPDLKKKGKVI